MEINSYIEIKYLIQKIVCACELKIKAEIASIFLRLEKGKEPRA